MHISRATFVGMEEQGPYRLRMPVTLHIAYCGEKVKGSQVAPEAVADCQMCQIALGWEEIDRLDTEAPR